MLLLRRVGAQTAAQHRKHCQHVRLLSTIATIVFIVQSKCNE